MLIPVIGIVQISEDAAHADRYTYLPQIGLALAVAWGVADWSAHWPYRRLILGGLMAVVIGSLVVCAHIQTSHWKDSETLWTRALACTAGDRVAHNNLGLAVAAKGRWDQAIAEYRDALGIDPDYAEAHRSLGLALAKKRQVDEAIAECRKALHLNPDDADAHNNLGFAYAQKGQLDKAMAHYRRALRMDPDNKEARQGLADARHRAGEAEWVKP
jgi:protein O-mannosyl-transferase